MLVQDGLQNNRLRCPDKVALVCCGRRLTYADVDSMADRLANALLANGIGRGDRVAVYLLNSIEAVVAIFAILKAGATFVLVNPSTKLDKLSYILGNCQASGLITNSQTAAHGTVSELRRRNAHLNLVVVTGAQSEDLCDGDCQLSYDSIQTDFPAV